MKPFDTALHIGVICYLIAVITLALKIIEIFETIKDYVSTLIEPFKYRVEGDASIEAPYGSHGY